jgi:hypothetical protein
MFHAALRCGRSISTRHVTRVFSDNPVARLAYRYVWGVSDAVTVVVVLVLVLVMVVVVVMVMVVVVVVYVKLPVNLANSAAMAASAFCDPSGHSKRWAAPPRCLAPPPFRTLLFARAAFHIRISTLSFKRIAHRTHTSRR